MWPGSLGLEGWSPGITGTIAHTGPWSVSLVGRFHRVQLGRLHLWGMVPLPLLKWPGVGLLDNSGFCGWCQYSVHVWTYLVLSPGHIGDISWTPSKRSSWLSQGWICLGSVPLRGVPIYPVSVSEPPDVVSWGIGQYPSTLIGCTSDPKSGPVVKGAPVLFQITKVQPWTLFVSKVGPYLPIPRIYWLQPA